MKNIAYLFRRSWAVSKRYFIVTCIKSIFTALIPLVNIAGIGLVINALEAEQSINEILRLIITYLLVNLIISLSSQLLTFFELTLMRKTTNVLQYEYMQDCINIDYHYVQDGKVLNLKQKSMLSQPAFFLPKLGACFNYIVQFIGILSIFALLSPIFIVVIIVISGLIIGLNLFTQKCDFNFNNEKVEDERKLEYLYSVMTGYKYAKEIRINNANTYISNKYSVILEKHVYRLKMLLCKKLEVDLLTVVLSVGQTAIMYIYFTYEVSTNQIDLAQYTVLLSSTMLFTSIVLSFFSTLGAINNTCKTIDFYLEYEQVLRENSITNDSNKRDEVANDFSRAIIKFENVSFIYPNAKDYVLNGIDLEIKPNKKLAIVGLNGSGKTTLIKLLLRLYQPTHGRITLDGIDISDMPYHQYIRHIGIVLQDFFLFAYSLKENIIFNSEYNEERFFTSIEKSGLTNKIRTLPNAIDTSIYRELDDNGIEFSGGEGQKLALARAIYKNADILILDEPTSALDPVAEYQLFSRLNEISDDKTTIFISHRLSSTYFCDNIIVLDNGCIGEQGNHEALMAQDGIYAQLYRAQAKYYERNEEISS